MGVVQQGPGTLDFGQGTASIEHAFLPRILSEVHVFVNASYCAVPWTFGGFEHSRKIRSSSQRHLETAEHLTALAPSRVDKAKELGPKGLAVSFTSRSCVQRPAESDVAVPPAAAAGSGFVSSFDFLPQLGRLSRDCSKPSSGAAVSAERTRDFLMGFCPKWDGSSAMYVITVWRPRKEAADRTQGENEVKSCKALPT